MRYFYVIGPVRSDPKSQLKKAVLKEVGAIYKITPFFPLEVRPNFSLEDTISDARSALFILADLTYERPSCYYEVGVTQALGLTVNIIAEKGTVIYQVAARDEIRYYSGQENYYACINEVLLAQDSL